MSSLLALSYLLALSHGDEQCQWDLMVKDRTFTLDLQPLQELEVPIQCGLGSGSGSSRFPGSHFLSRLSSNRMLQYTPCRNGINCSIPSMVSMSKMVSNRSLPRCAAFLGVWDSGRTQPLFIDNEEMKGTGNGREQYVFEYENGSREPFGNCSDGRHLNVSYVCDEDIATYSESNISCRELSDENGTCFYEMVIATKLACLGAVAPNNKSRSGLHAPVWMAIIFGVVFMFYCVSGYILNATRYGKWTDILGNVPNANLWCCCCFKERTYITVRQSTAVNALMQDEF